MQADNDEADMEEMEALTKSPNAEDAVTHGPT
jgi:hypothetical protein